MYNGSNVISVSIPENQKAAIAKRYNFRHAHDYPIPGGPTVDMSPIMTPDEKERYKELGDRASEDHDCRWPFHFVAGMGPHPNAHEPWAFPRDDDAPPPPPRDDDDDDDVPLRDQFNPDAPPVASPVASPVAPPVASPVASPQQEQQEQETVDDLIAGCRYTSVRAAAGGGGTAE